MGGYGSWVGQWWDPSGGDGWLSILELVSFLQRTFVNDWHFSDMCPQFQGTRTIPIMEGSEYNHIHAFVQVQNPYHLKSSHVIMFFTIIIMFMMFMMFMRGRGSGLEATVLRSN